MSVKTSILIDLLVDQLEREEQNARPVAKQRAQQDLMQRLAGYRVRWEEGDDLEPRTIRQAREESCGTGPDTAEPTRPMNPRDPWLYT